MNNTRLFLILGICAVLTSVAAILLNSGHDSHGVEKTLIQHTTVSNPPKYVIPDLACDCHHHIYNPEEFPYIYSSLTQPAATAEDYTKLQQYLHLTRSVVVQPAAYGTDNRCTLDAVQKLGTENTRAIVVVAPEISAEELQEMHQAGARGVRINIASGGTSDFAELYALAEKIAPMGWSMHFWMSPDYIVNNIDTLRDFPCQILFDHLGHIPTNDTGEHEAVALICELLRDGKAWVKLSGIYLDSTADGYTDTIAIGRRYVQANPDRCLWGTDWPHPTSYNKKQPYPDDAAMLDALMKMAGTEDIFHRILVENPAELFGFGS